MLKCKNYNIIGGGGLWEYKGDLWLEPVHAIGRSVQHMAVEGICAKILLILHDRASICVGRMAGLSKRENSRICLQLWFEC